MIPNDMSLMLSVKRAIEEMEKEVAEGDHNATLRTIAISVNELLLRQDNSFYLEYYQKGLDLVHSGLELGLGEADGVDDLPNQLGTDINSNTIGQYTKKMTSILESFVKNTKSPDSNSVSDYLNRIADWEVSLYQHRMTWFDDQANKTASPKLTKGSLQSYLRQKFSDKGSLEVTAFSRLPGGYSKLTVMFSTNIPLFGSTEFVIRAEQASIIEHVGGKSENEYFVMRFAYEQGVRIPEPLWVELDSEKLGARFVVSRKAGGSIYGTTVGSSTQLGKTVLQDLAKELVKIHSIEVDRENALVKNSHLSTWTKIATLRENVLYKIQYWREILDTSPHSPSPLIERCFNWLSANIPEPNDSPSLIHGDYGLHNILIEDARVTAVLDWEVAHVGDRAHDIIWFIICMTGTASYDEVLELYYEAGGLPVSEERLRFYDVFESFNLLIVCNIALARLDLNGESPALAEIGLRVMHFFAERVKAKIG